MGKIFSELERRTSQFLQYLDLMKRRVWRTGASDGFIIFTADHSPEELNRCQQGRWIQLAFKQKYFYMDQPNTTLSTTESFRLVTERNGFFFYLADGSRKPAEYERTFNPVQRHYKYGEEQTAATDIAFIFFDLWRLPLDIWIEIRAMPFDGNQVWERGGLYFG